MSINFEDRGNIFNNTTLYNRNEAIKIYYPNKYILVKNMVMGNSFICGKNLFNMESMYN